MGQLVCKHDSGYWWLSLTHMTLPLLGAGQKKQSHKNRALFLLLGVLETEPCERVNNAGSKQMLVKWRFLVFLPIEWRYWIRCSPRIVLSLGLWLCVGFVCPASVPLLPVRAPNFCEQNCPTSSLSQGRKHPVSASGSIIPSLPSNRQNQRDSNQASESLLRAHCRNS